MTDFETIFVLIASYRDTECQWTVKDLFEKAHHPGRIYAGICWQADPVDDRDCFEVETRPDQVRTVHYLPSESQGLGWARAQAYALWRGEDYVLQIDSHMRFVQDWDVQMLTNLAECDSPKPLLSVYPPSYQLPNEREENAPVRVQCIREFSPKGILFYTASKLPEGVQATAPIPTACCAGAFIFGSSSWTEDVAHDPDVFFNGEEHALATRLWTHGYDLFSPNKTLLYHYYGRQEAPRIWSDDPTWHIRHKKTLTRLRQLVAPDTVPERDRTILGRYGLGSKRSLEAYEAWSGVNYAARSIAPFAKVFPFVRTEDVAAVLRTDHSIKVSPKAVLFIVEDEGILYSSIRGEIYRLNSAATWVWCALEHGEKWDSLISGLSTLCNLDAIEAESALVTLVAHWHGQRVLEGDEIAVVGANLEPERDLETLSNTGDDIPMPANTEFYEEQFYQLSDRTFCVRFGEPEHCERLMPSLRHLEVANSRIPDHVIVIHENAGDHFIFCDQQQICGPMAISRLTTYLSNQFAILVLENLDHILTLHAGVVEKNGYVVALPGESGDGKSTLVAGLIKSGFHYLSDELAPLARGSGHVIPMPLSLCVKEDGVPVLKDLYPEMSNLPINDRDDGRRALYLPPPIATIVGTEENRRISHIVFPRYAAGAETQLRRIGRVEAFGRLLERCISIPSRLTVEDAALLVGWIERVDCFEMTSGSLESSIEVIDSLVKE